MNSYKEAKRSKGCQKETESEGVEEIGRQEYIKDIIIENKIYKELYYYFHHLLFISIIYKNKGQTDKRI